MSVDKTSCDLLHASRVFQKKGRKKNLFSLYHVEEGRTEKILQEFNVVARSGSSFLRHRCGSHFYF